MRKPTRSGFAPEDRIRSRRRMGAADAERGWDARDAAGSIGSMSVPPGSSLCLTFHFA